MGNHQIRQEIDDIEIPLEHLSDFFGVCRMDRASWDASLFESFLDIDFKVLITRKWPNIKRY